MATMIMFWVGLASLIYGGYQVLLRDRVSGMGWVLIGALTAVAGMVLSLK